MGRIIDLFVQEMPARVESLLASWRDRNLESLRRAAHQLRGAGGGYGFPAVSTAAGTLEASLARLSKGGGEHQLENLRKQFEELVELCRRVSAE
jgi:HPt (histidine-containing phosphotransfer) domain-containing protein